MQVIWLNNKSRVSGDVHARFCESLKGKFLWATRLILIGLTLDDAKDFKEKIENFVKDKLNLELSHWHIQKIKRGINFVGYRTWKRIKFVRKHSMYKMKKAIKKIKLESIISLIGHAKGTATIKYYRELLIEFSIFNLLPNRSQKCLFM